MHYARRKRFMSKIGRRIRQVFHIVRNTFFIISFLFTLLFFGIIGWIYWEFTRVPDVKPETILVMNMKGLILDGPSMSSSSQRILGEDVQTRQGIVNNIRKARQDSRIIGILLNMESYGMSLTTTLEIREELIAFKQTRKKLFAYMSSAGMRTYLLVSPADKIYMLPSGDTYAMGFRAEVPFYKKMFDNIGVVPEFVAIGKYKTAPQIFTMEQMSEEYREVLNDLLGAYYDSYVEMVAEARNVSVERVKAWVDDGLYSAPEALEAGMVDELVYESQLEKKLQVELGLIEEREEPKPEIEPEIEAETAPETETDKEKQEKAEKEPELNTVNNSQYARVKVDAPNLYNKGEKIAVIYAQGSIVSGKSAPPSSGSPTIGAETMTELLESLAEDEEIKGIILRIDSGGGGARASDIIRNSIEEAKHEKPIIVSMAGTAASGGYMISVSADTIMAYPLTLTGSIGIFGGKFSMEGLNDWIGIKIETVQRGKNAGMFSPSYAQTEEEQERFRHNIQQGYDQFVEGIAQGRGMTFEAVDEIARGRVWMGKQAAEIGLVDTLGGMDEAIALMKAKLEIPEDEEVQLVDYPQMGSPFELLFLRLRETYVDTKFPEELRKIRAQLEKLAQLQDERLFAWWPCRIVVE